MGTDLSYVIERRHRDGGWEAVLSLDWICHTLGRDYVDFLQSDDARVEVGERSYTRYGLLSGMREDARPDIGTIATDGLPEDASASARAHVEEFELRSVGTHTLPRIETAIADLRRVDGIAAHSTTLMEMYLRGLRALMANEGSYHLPVDGILFGRVRDTQDNLFPDMVQASNHARLSAAERASGLMPVSDDTVRVIIGYS